MILKLKDGDIKIELFEDVAPNHVKRIKQLAKDGKYDGVVFTGGAMRINDMTDVIKKHINFASNCFAEKKKNFSNLLGTTGLLDSSRR